MTKGAPALCHLLFVICHPLGGRIRQRDPADERADIDDAAAFAEMLECSLSRQKRPEHVDIKHPVELFLGNCFDWSKFVNSRVINQDIELLNKLSTALIFRLLMRPLFHPPIEAVTVEGILHAPADPVRVAIYADIFGSDCAYNCSNFLKVSEKKIPKSTLSHHFKALREAGLIRSEWRGVEMHNTSRCSEIESRFPGLIATILKAHKTQIENRLAAPKRKPRKAG